MRINFRFLTLITIFLLLALSPFVVSAHQQTDILLNTSPSWSPDGEQIAFESNRSGKYDIWIINKSDKTSMNLTQPIVDISFSEPEWSPNGEYIAFSSDQGDIWIIEPDGDNPRNLTEKEDMLFGGPQWSLNGVYICFGALEMSGSSIWIYGLEDNSLSKLIYFENAFVTFPKWSPDGKTIAANLVDFSRPIGESTSIVFINVDDPTEIELTEPNPFGPLNWSPDNKSIVTTLDEAPSSNVVIVDRETLNLTYLAEDLKAYEPVWSPDGRTIAFERYFGDSITTTQIDIWLVNLDDKKTMELATSDTMDESNPRWSLDGRQLAFERTMNDITDIWVVNADGSNPINLTGQP